MYITGEAVYNSPERDVELVAIPGRNGELARDKDRFLNVEVTYPAGAKRKNEQDFAEIISQFRNLMASKRGYQRLVDDYNPNEYRMGVFKEAIEVEATGSQNAGEFDLVFNCKPQRFLMSGEADIDIDHGDLGSGFHIFNPTPFEAQPLIKCEGYGLLEINDHTIQINNEVLGSVVLANGGSDSQVQFDSNLVNNNDDITIDRVDTAVGFVIVPSKSTIAVTSVTPPATAEYSINGSGQFTTMSMAFTELGFQYGTSKTVTESWVVSISITKNGVTTTEQLTITLTVTYDGANGFSFSSSYSGGTFEKYIDITDFSYSDIVADSTVSNLGNPTYIDCDLGEVYKVDNGSFISLNRLVDLGSKLPSLVPGDNVITGENSFSLVTIVPRWWVV